MGEKNASEKIHKSPEEILDIEKRRGQYEEMIGRQTAQYNSTTHDKKIIDEEVVYADADFERYIRNEKDEGNWWYNTFGKDEIEQNSSSILSVGKRFVHMGKDDRGEFGVIRVIMDGYIDGKKIRIEMDEDGKNVKSAEVDGEAIPFEEAKKIFKKYWGIAEKRQDYMDISFPRQRPL